MIGRTALVAVMAVALLFPALRAADAPPATVTPDPWQRAIGPWNWLFPRDHGAHPNFKTEWWYFTGNLWDDETHDRFGYQLTIFRQGVQFQPVQVHSQWAVRDFYFGHFTISDIGAKQFHFAEKVSRGGVLGEAVANTGSMSVNLGPWTIDQEENGRINLQAADHGMEIFLAGRAPNGLVLEGEKGLSRKGSGVGEASYYYSYPLLDMAGRLTVNGRTRPVSGLTWFDHEFSTSSLGQDQVGWDWFSIQLGGEFGPQIMLYAMRDKSGAIDPASEGTWINAVGPAGPKSERLLPGSFTIEKRGTWKSPHSGATYPAGWHVTIPSHHADLTILPAMADQELRLTKMGTLDYWEGACDAKGTLDGKPIAGVGYTELTGYAGNLQAGLRN